MLFRCDPFVRLVLTGVCVSNFLNIAKFDLIFLHNTHILSVFLFVGLFVNIFYLSCLSVCLMYSNVGMYCIRIWILVFLYICLFFQPVQVLLHCPSVCLFVCVCLYVFISVCLYVYLYICLSVPLSVCLSAFLPFWIPSGLPALLPACLPAFLPDYLPACLPACLAACLPACQPTYLPACLHE